MKKASSITISDAPQKRPWNTYKSVKAIIDESIGDDKNYLLATGIADSLGIGTVKGMTLPMMEIIRPVLEKKIIDYIPLDSQGNLQEIFTISDKSQLSASEIYTLAKISPDPKLDSNQITLEVLLKAEVILEWFKDTIIIEGLLSVDFYEIKPKMSIESGDLFTLSNQYETKKEWVLKHGQIFNLFFSSITNARSTVEGEGSYRFLIRDSISSYLGETYKMDYKPIDQFRKLMVLCKGIETSFPGLGRSMMKWLSPDGIDIVDVLAKNNLDWREADQEDATVYGFIKSEIYAKALKDKIISSNMKKNSHQWTIVQKNFLNNFKNVKAVHNLLSIWDVCLIIGKDFFSINHVKTNSPDTGMVGLTNFINLIVEQTSGGAVDTLSYEKIRASLLKTAYCPLPHFKLY